MEKKKIGDGLVGTLQKAADTAKAVKMVAQDMAADAKKSREKRKAQQKAEDQKAPKAAAGASAAKPEKSAMLKIKLIANKSALQIIYYLMAADGSVSHEEAEKFDAIGVELDTHFADSRAAIIKECQAQLDKTDDPADYYDALRDGVEAAIRSPADAADAFITPKLLTWDLLTVTYSDKSCDEAERKLLEYIVQRLGISKDVFLEMESSMLTMADIDRELAWIKTTDWPYLTIEARVSELTKRKAVVFDSVKDLVTL